METEKENIRKKIEERIGKMAIFFFKGEEGGVLATIKDINQAGEVKVLSSRAGDKEEERKETWSLEDIEDVGDEEEFDRID